MVRNSPGARPSLAGENASAMPTHQTKDNGSSFQPGGFKSSGVGASPITLVKLPNLSATSSIEFTQESAPESCSDLEPESFQKSVPLLIEFGRGSAVGAKNGRD